MSSAPPNNALALVQQTLAKLPSNTPIYMLNLIKFRRTATYPPTSSSSDESSSSLTGSQAYFQKYIPAFRTIASKFGGKSKLHFLGTAMANVIAEPGDQEWDVVMLVRYESKEAFAEIATSEEYARDAGPHREAAVEVWKLVATVEKAFGR